MHPQGFGWGFLFGVFLLFQKMTVIIIIGTSIRATNLVPFHASQYENMPLIMLQGDVGTSYTHVECGVAKM